MAIGINSFGEDPDQVFSVDPDWGDHQESWALVFLHGLGQLRALLP